MIKTICIGLILGFLHWVTPAANAEMSDSDTNCKGGINGTWSPAKKACMKCGDYASWDESKERCDGNCSHEPFKKSYDPKTGNCVCPACDSEHEQNPTTCACTPSCAGGFRMDGTPCSKPKCKTLWQVYDATTNTCVAKIYDLPPDPVLPVDNPPTPTTIKKYKNSNLHNCLEGAKNPSSPTTAEFDCVPTPQNEDGSLSNAADKDYTKWSDELYAGKNRSKPVNGFYSKKLVRCDDATAPSEQCPIAVKAKFVITCKKSGPTWSATLNKCTEAQKIRTFYATYQAFTIPGQKPIKPNIVGDSTTSNTPATSIQLEAIKGAAP